MKFKKILMKFNFALCSQVRTDTVDMWAHALGILANGKAIKVRVNLWIVSTTNCAAPVALEAPGAKSESVSIGDKIADGPLAGAVTEAPGK